MKFVISGLFSIMTGGMAIGVLIGWIQPPSKLSVGEGVLVWLVLMSAECILLKLHGIRDELQKLGKEK